MIIRYPDLVKFLEDPDTVKKLLVYCPVHMRDACDLIYQKMRSTHWRETPESHLFHAMCAVIVVEIARQQVEDGVRKAAEHKLSDVCEACGGPVPK